MSYIDEVGDQEIMEFMEEEYRINQKKKKGDKKPRMELGNDPIMEVEEVFREESSEDKLRSDSEEVVFEESD